MNTFNRKPTNKRKFTSIYNSKNKDSFDITDWIKRVERKFITIDGKRVEATVKVCKTPMEQYPTKD